MTRFGDADPDDRDDPQAESEAEELLRWAADLLVDLSGPKVRLWRAVYRYRFDRRLERR